MKNICKIILALAICACLALPFAGCDTYQNSENCGGIVRGYEYIGEEEIQIPFTENKYFTSVRIEVTFKKNSNKYYPYLIVVESFFEYYNCDSIEELFVNKDFINSYAKLMTVKVENDKSIIGINKALISNASVYFYEGITENNGPIKIEDFNNYIGYFNYN